MHVFSHLHHSRVRTALALIFVFSGLVAAIGAALAAWYLSAIITAFVASTGLPAFVGAANTLVAASLVLGGLAVAVALVPLPWHGATPELQPLIALPAVPAITLDDTAREALPSPLQPEPAPPDSINLINPINPIIDAPFRELNAIPLMSVYVDAENKSFSIPELEVFFRLLDAQIGNQHADRFFYIDVKQLADKVRAIYETGGFTLKNVPHKAQAAPLHVDGAQTKNAVDIAMALDILERALLGPRGQKIILVTADRDYFPLLIRLKGLGHEVTLWARSPDAKFKEWCSTLGVGVVDLDKVPSLRAEHAPRKKRH